MRDIKFRGFWKTVAGEWQSAIGNLSIVDNKVRSGWFISNKYGSPWAYEVRPETVGQYTGLKDRNKVEIYEGDIVVYEEEGTPYTVKWENGYLQDLFAGGVINEIKVIGNIYENPELLREY